MNKYSKRALKTTATVGMSLAMVLSGVAAPVMAATTTLTCNVAKTYTAGQVLKSVSDIEGVKADTAVKAELVAKINAMPATAKIEVGKSKVNAYLGYKTSAGQLTKVSAQAITTTEIAVGTEYGYYATANTTIWNSDNATEEISVDAKLDVKSIVAGDFAARTGTEVLSDINKVTAPEAITIRNEKNETSNLEVKPMYSIDSGAATEVKPEASALNTATSVKVEYVVVKETKDHTCTTNTVAGGITIDGQTHAKNVYRGIETSFDKAEYTLETIQWGKEVDFTKATSTSELGKLIVLEGTTLANAKVNIDFEATLKNLSKVLDSDSDEGKAIERFLNIDDAMHKVATAVTKFNDVKYTEDTELTSKNFQTTVELLKEFTDFDTYLTNLSEDDAEVITSRRDTLQTLVDGYVADNDGEMIDEYLTLLEKHYDLFVEEEGKAGITKADVDAAIKRIKKGGTYSDGKVSVTLEESEYVAFKEIDGVVDYLTKFEEMYDEITAVKNAVAKTNDAYKDLVKGGKDSVKSFLTAKVEGNNKTFDDILDDISIEDYKILKTYKEEVLDVLMTTEAKEVGNTYVNKNAKSIYATKLQLNTVLDLIGNRANADAIKDKTGVFTTLDRETGDFNWDVLVAHMDKVVASHELLTKGIAKLDPITLVAGDRATILAADDAVYFLELGGKGAGNLTSSEARDVRNAQRKVNELLEAYRVKFGSISEISGWENKGNGDWAYYENGNAVTKWVAAGSDWYYVSNGLMLRNSWIAQDSTGAKWYYVDDAGKMVSNTTIGGYVIDANGVWTK